MSGPFLLDSRTSQLVAQTEVDGTAHNAAFMTAGPITYALAEHGIVHFADATTLTSTGEVDVGGAPLEVTPIPRTSYVMVADSSTGKLIVVDSVARQVNTSIPTGTNPIGVRTFSSRASPGRR